MIRYSLLKLGRAALTLFAVLVFTFVILRLTGDPVEAILPDDTPPEIVEIYRVKWGVDRPIPEQFLRYLQNVAQGSLGRSFRDGREATEIVAERVPATVWLAAWSLGLTLALGIPLGILAALRHGSVLDRALMTASVLGYAIPNFLLGIVLIYLFAVTFRWLPSYGAETWRHLILPVLTLGTSGAAVYARFARIAVLDVLRQPYVRAAQADGWAGAALMLRHVLPNAAIPLVTTLGFSLAGLIGGSIIVETVFAWPGIGRLLVQSVGTRDLAVVQALVLLFTAFMVAANLAVDLSYGLLNPKIRLAGR